MNYFYVYKDSRNEYRWHLKSANGRIIADSGEGYVTKQGCLEGIQIVKNSINYPVVGI